MSKSDETWSAGEMLGNAENSIGTVMRTAVDDYYKGQDLDTAQAIRGAASDTEARIMITAMRQGRWQDLVLVAGVTTVGAVMGATIQRFLNDPRVQGVSPVALLGFISVIAGLAAPVSVVGRAALVAGGATYAAGAQLFGWKGKEP